MKHLIIIGARGFGREVYITATESIGYGTDFEVKGYLDDNADALDGYNGYPPIISSVEDYEPQDNDIFVCALGDVEWKEHYVEKVLAKGGKFVTLTHRHAYISKNVKIGVGCIVCNQAIISCDVTIGDFTTIQPHVIIGHDCQIGSMCQINSNTSIGGFVIVGDKATLHTSTTLLPKSKIGNNATVGAGSVVLRKVSAGSTVFGNPACSINL